MIEGIKGEEVLDLRHLQNMASDAMGAIDDLLTLCKDSEPEDRGAARYALQVALEALHRAMGDYI